MFGFVFISQSTLSFKPLFYEVAQIKHNPFLETGSHSEALAVLEHAMETGKGFEHRDPSASQVLALIVSAIALGYTENSYKSFQNHKTHLYPASLLGTSDFQILVITIIQHAVIPSDPEACLNCQICAHAGEQVDITATTLFGLY